MCAVLRYLWRYEKPIYIFLKATERKVLLQKLERIQEKKKKRNVLLHISEMFHMWALGCTAHIKTVFHYLPKANRLLAPYWLFWVTFGSSDGRSFELQLKVMSAPPPTHHHYLYSGGCSQRVTTQFKHKAQHDLSLSEGHRSTYGVAA